MFLVADLDKLDSTVPLQRAEHSVDAIARIAVDPPDAPGLEAVDEKVTGVHVGPNARASRLAPELIVFGIAPS